MPTGVLVDVADGGASMPGDGTEHAALVDASSGPGGTQALTGGLQTVSSLITGSSMCTDSLPVPVELLASQGTAEAAAACAALAPQASGQLPQPLALSTTAGALQRMHSMALASAGASGSSGANGELMHALSDAAGAGSPVGSIGQGAPGIAQALGGMSGRGGSGTAAAWVHSAGAGMLAGAAGTLQGVLAGGAGAMPLGSPGILPGRGGAGRGAAAAVAAAGLVSNAVAAQGGRAAPIPGQPGPMPAASADVGRAQLPGGQAGSAAAEDAPLAGALAAIEQRFELSKGPLGRLQGQLNVVQRFVQKVDGRLEVLQQAVPLVATLVGPVRTQLAVVGKSNVVEVLVSNWDQLQPEWMKSARMWLGRAVVLWKKRGTMTVKVLHVNADWPNSAARRM